MKNSENLVRALVTCDLLYWEGDKTHCFLRWGDRCDGRFKYRKIFLTIHKKDGGKYRVGVFYAMHNPQDTVSLNALVKTVTLNIGQVLKEG